MHPLVKSFSGLAVRAVMLMAGAAGVELGNEQAETLVNAALIVGALAWSAYQKWRTNDRIQTAQLQADLAINRPR